MIGVKSSIIGGENIITFFFFAFSITKMKEKLRDTSKSKFNNAHSLYMNGTFNKGGDIVHHFYCM